MRFNSGFARNSLRARVAFGLMLPVLVLLAALSYIHYQRERRLIETQLMQFAQQLGEFALSTLNHAMLNHDEAMIRRIVEDVESREGIHRVQIIGSEKRVWIDTQGLTEGQYVDLEEAGCEECHRYPAETRPHTTHLLTSETTLRVSTPIPFDSACGACHQQEGSHLGVLLLDVSQVDLQQHILRDLKLDLVFAIAGTVLSTLVVFVLVNWLVVRRVDAFRRPLQLLAGGDFRARLPAPSTPKDEIDRLAAAFNKMAADLEERARQQEERGRIREQAIAEERERIARELHDGLAQLLGYVNTKVTAVRLLLRQQRIDTADRQLAQLEEAARELFVETREAIIGLKVSTNGRGGLIASLRSFVEQFQRLSDFPVYFSVTPSDVRNDLLLPAESELQLLRIAQEALSNVRKHAQAHHAWVEVQVDPHSFTLSIRDDGKGFVPEKARGDRKPRFGLSTMRERAEAIGARFEIRSVPDEGTSVVVQVKR